MITWHQLRRTLHQQLSTFLEPEEARAETERWIQDGLDRSRSWLAAHGNETLPEGTFERVEAWLARRRTGEPWAYILGWCVFRDRRYNVNPHVLIPRPETELVLEAALDVGRRLGVLHGTDVGTGSGILAISLALETDWKVVATDISRKALKVARHNAQTLGAHVTFHEGDLLGPVPDPVGLVVSNPPYVDPADRPTLQRELSFEPPGALFAEDRGYALATELLRQARTRSAPGVVMEIGAGQGPELLRRARTLGWSRSMVHQDWAGHDRILVVIS